jgi:hypothetical protein
MYRETWSTLHNGIHPDAVVRESDGAWIPRDEGNMDWREYVEWKGKGNKLSPATNQPPPTPPGIDLADLVKRIEALEGRVKELGSSAKGTE